MTATTDAARIWMRRLGEDGYCVIPNALPAQLVLALAAELDPIFGETPFCEGDFYGARTKRFGGLLKRSRHAEAFVRQPLVLYIAEQLLGPWCDRIALNLTQAVEIQPGASPQYPHRDEDMWQGPKGELQYLLNVMWPLVPFTAANGGTLIWPRSHRGPGLAEADPGQPIEMDIGSALLFLGSTLHAGGGNVTGAPRRGLIVSYCLGWLKPFELQWLVYPPAIARHFDPELAALVGYAQHRPNLGNVEGRCPSELLEGGEPTAAAARDALRPDQAEALRAFVRAQCASPE